MANQGRARTTKELRYFFLNGQLHKILKVRALANLVTCKNFETGEEVVYLWSDVRNNAERAYSELEVCRLFGCSRMTIWRHYNKSQLPPPARADPQLWNTNPVEAINQPRPKKYSGKDILMLHDSIMDTKDGRVPRIKNKMTRAEVQAWLDGEDVLYYKTEDGNFMPLWRATL